MPYKVTPEKVVDRMKILVYGPQGAGKTYLAATAQDHPAMRDVLFLSIEGGLMTVAHRGDIMAEDIPSTDALEDIFWKIANKDPKYAQFKTLVIDSGTELQTMNLEEIVRQAIEKETKQKGDKARKTDIDEFWQDDYGKSTNQLKRIFRWYKSLPINIIITALPKKVYPRNRSNQEDVEPTEVRPAFTSKLGDAVMGFVDFVWYLWDAGGEDGKIHRYMLTRNKGIFQAKTRGVKFAEALGEVVVDPYLPDLYELFLKSGTDADNQKQISE